MPVSRWRITMTFSGQRYSFASRLCGEAEVDGIVVSGFVRELCDVDAECFIELGGRRLNDPARAGAYRGSIPATRAMAPVEQQEASGRTIRRANERPQRTSTNVAEGAKPEATHVATSFRSALEAVIPPTTIGRQ